MEKKRGLGRGLDNFFGAQQEENKEAETLAVDAIETNPHQPRKYFSEESIDELAESIRAVGVLQPLLIKKDGDTNLLIAGERRLRAAKRAGLKEVPVRFIDVDEEKGDRISLIENVQREDLNPMEEAEAYETLRKKYKYTQEKIAGLVGKSRPYIANSLRLLKLEPVVKEMLRREELSISQGKLLLSVKDGNAQIKQAKRMVDEGQTIAESTQNTKKSTKKRRDHQGYYSYLENALMDVLGTKTEIVGNHEKGKIVIDYYSEDDLMRLCDQILEDDIDG
ncbi:ParB/RepB/Spo0J family partition protein [Aedoeadaptatus urinae]|uniref:ParB/RepB/Spo0J family partition protein n=1 Tax=Aedoeadaptatus urinae TaxID=1871017 RepID=UPI00097CFC45|nr:ParB/RepB/Spo0J family partition protein [Peptoniphilus urinae]